MKKDKALALGAAAIGLGAIVVAARSMSRQQPVRVPTPQPLPHPNRAPPRWRRRVRGPAEPPDPVRAVLEEAAGPINSETDPEERLDELLELHFAVDPTPGKYYQVTKKDTPETIARAVLRQLGTFTSQNVLDYIHCMTSSPWNLNRYGGPSTSRRYPERWLVPGFGQGIRAAFLPRNADAVHLMGAGVTPGRSVDEHAKALGDGKSYGLLWLPPASLQSGHLTCVGFSWADGSSKLNPDPELLGLLEAA